MSDSEGDGPPMAKTKKPKSTKQTIENIYQKKTQLEHILLRPDTYIGSVEPCNMENMWVFDSEQEKMVQRNVTYVPGLYKIFDEILVNAADNKQRDPKMNLIKITIDPDKNEISVWNNGKGIPVEMHKDEKMYVPTMIFGHLLTSSNYNDEEEKVTGGRNGYGAKLCNIFSKKFVVETSCKESKRKFKQMWTDNMNKAGDVKIGDASNEDYTKITFQPDLAKFKMDRLDRDIVDLMSRRAYDVAATTGGVKVVLNDKRLPIKGFKDYVELIVKGKEDDIGNPIKINYERVSDRWEVACCISDNGFQQISFVNSIATTKGGRHVDYVTDMLVKQLVEVIKKKNKGGINIKPFQIKNHMFVFVNCLIVNPTFDSQTKETMTLQAKNFGSKCTMSDKYINMVLKSGITEAVLTWAKFKAQTQLEKVGGKKKNKLKGVAKLEDANEAGGRNAHRCTLILTEGDSAKTLAVSGLAVVGRDHYGVFPLRGKLLNVREASHKQILDNAEINNIIKIMGLQYKKKYIVQDDLKSLRYGKLMIMTDQDQDGSHIKGLLINFLHHNWPELLRLNFLEEFITPIVKASRKNQETISFYSIPEFEEWKTNTPNHAKYSIKYYKGLGTSTGKEAKEYFLDMKRHQIRFKYGGPDDDNSIQMAFSKKCVDQRKDWLTNWMQDCKRRQEMGLPEQYLYEKDTKSIDFSSFINKELVLFSNADNERSIPSMVDGLKPGQRKVLFTCFKRNDKKEIKVAQLAGSVAEHSAYHHGEASLMSTIINLAQNYVGSNNINLLMPNGQFGTRLQGGKDAASPRYIFTQLNPVTKAMFIEHDVPLLKQQTEDNQKIEPAWYIPIIPTVLVNGADGIGTGWMTKIPNYNPREIVENIKAMIRGDEPSQMVPWYKGFKGSVVEVSHQRYVISGEVRVIDDTQIEITELPIGTWTQNYKESVLEPMLHGGEKTPATITDFKEYHTDTTVRFVVMMSPAQLAKWEHEGLYKVFKLQTTIANTSMVLFDHLGCLTKFEHVNDILHKFYDLRLDYYGRRKEFLLSKLRAEARRLTNQARFILEKCDGDLVIENKKKVDMIKELVHRKYDSDPVEAWKKEQNMDPRVDEDAEGTTTADDAGGPDYDYLLGMKLWSLTKERKDELLRNRDAKLAEVEELKKKTPQRLWGEDLDNLLVVLDKQEALEAEETTKAMKDKMKGTGAKKLKLAAETMPSPKGRKVEPTIDPELKKKIEKAVQAKENKGKGKAKKEAAALDPEDEFDAFEAALKPLNERIGNSPELLEKKFATKKKELKQTKLNFKATKKVKGSDSEGSDFDAEEANSSFEAHAAAASRAPPRRAAAAKAKFTYDSDEEFMTDEEARPNGKAAASSEDERPPPVKRVTNFSDSDSDDVVQVKKKNGRPNVTSDSLFDDLISGGGGGGGGGASGSGHNASGSSHDTSGGSEPMIVEDSIEQRRSPSPPPVPKKPKAAPKPKATAAPKADKPKPKPKAEPKQKRKLAKYKGSDSDSDDMFEVSKKRAPVKKKKVSLSGSEEEEEKGSGSDDSYKPRPREGRARKPVAYKFSDGEDSD